MLRKVIKQVICSLTSELACGFEKEDLKEEKLAFFFFFTMLLLEQFTCEKEYLAFYENEDKRIIWDNNQILYVASAYVNEHKFREATQIIEKTVRKAGITKII